MFWRMTLDARNTRRPHGVSLSPAHVALLRARIERDGEPATLRALGISRQTIARCVAGLTVQRATAECVSRRLDDLAAKEAPV